jgi:hypothetical protein
MAALDALPPALRSLEPVADEETAASAARSGVAAGDLTQPGNGWTVRLSDGLRALAAEVRADLADGPGSVYGISRSGEISRTQNAHGAHGVEVR